MSSQDVLEKPEQGHSKPGRTGKRIQFEFAADAYERLGNIKEMTEAGTYADVVKNALRLYEWFLEQQGDGYEIGLIKDGKLVKQVEFYF